MKKILAVVLALVLAFSMTACSGSGLEGSWKFQSVKINGEDALKSQGIDVIGALEKQGFYLGMTFKSDKTGSMYMDANSGKTTFSWDSGKKTITIENESIPYTVNGDTLTIKKDGDDSNVMVLKKMTADEAKKFENQSSDDLLKAIQEIVWEKLKSEAFDSDEE